MVEPVTIDFSGFAPYAVTKVTQLIRILARISENPSLASQVCLHGGTALNPDPPIHAYYASPSGHAGLPTDVQQASSLPSRRPPCHRTHLVPLVTAAIGGSGLNLFLLSSPRLSVDIDLNYITSPDRQTMLTARPAVEQAIVDVGHELGFSVLPGKDQHAGRSFRLRYDSGQGSDDVKIDLDYLNRSPLLPPQPKSIAVATGGQVSFLLNSDIELFAGKTKALLERVAVRDLYDVGNISAIWPAFLNHGDERLLRRVMLYYLSVCAPLPRPFTVASRFAGREQEVVNVLYPMLLSSDRPALASMIGTAESFIAAVSQPSDAAEAEYMDRAAHADFAPELLFADYPDTLASARVDPAAAWKMRNLAQGG